MIFNNKKKELNSIEFPNEIEIQNKKYLIQVVFSSKKSSSVVINKETLIFRMSTKLSAKLAQEHFSELLKKIYKKIEKNQNVQKEYSIKDIIESGEFKFANQIYKLEYTKKTRGVKLIENTFYVNYTTKKENIEKHILKLLTTIYSQRVKNYVYKLNSLTYNYSIKEVELKLVNSKWGHCTYDNKIMLNLKLLNASIEIFDYVIIHELAHIKHKNHSQTYWREVARFCPNYINLRKMLKTNSPLLYYKV